MTWSSQSDQRSRLKYCRFSFLVIPENFRIFMGKVRWKMSQGLWLFW